MLHGRQAERLHQVQFVVTLGPIVSPLRQMRRRRPRAARQLGRAVGFFDGPFRSRDSLWLWPVAQTQGGPDRSGSLEPSLQSDIAAGPPPLQTPSDLRHVELLHDEPRRAWRHWCEHAGVAGIDLQAGASFNDASLALQAAVDGQA